MLRRLSTFALLAVVALVPAKSQAQSPGDLLGSVVRAIVADGTALPRICVSSKPLPNDHQGSAQIKTTTQELIAQEALDSAILQHQWSKQQTSGSLQEAFALTKLSPFRLVNRDTYDRCDAVIAIEPPYLWNGKLLVRAIIGLSPYGSYQRAYLFDVAGDRARLIAKTPQEIIVS